MVSPDHPMNGRVFPDYAGRQLGNYIIHEKIGEGAISSVYRAHAVDDPSRIVAIKIMMPAFTSDVALVTRFMREMDMLRTLDHPNIIHIYDSGSTSSIIYYVMEHVAGQTLRDMLNEKKRLPAPQSVEIAIQVTNALIYTHSHGPILHRDIKPENIMVDRWTHVKVLDFGLARIVGSSTITPSGVVVGSLFYVPPEQLTWGQKTDERGDIYSLGLVLYEMITGERPFKGKGINELSHSILNGQIMFPKDPDGDIPIALEQIIFRAMARKPEDRIPSAQILHDELVALQRAMNWS
jgi:eukaryotic-like serine/threonine-protein kinase